MKLNLARPLAFIDLETTGTNISTDRIVQIAVLKVFPDGTEKLKQQILNPTIPIPVEASQVHGIYDKDVVGKKTFFDIAPGIVYFIDDCDLAGYNSNKFDIPLLVAEFLRVGIDFKLEGRKFIDVQTIFHKMEPRNLKAAYKYYCGQELDGAHNAANDIRATYEVFKSQLQKYENVELEDNNGNSYHPIQNDTDVLAAFTPFDLLDPTRRIVYNDSHVETLAFGKYNGKTLVEVYATDPGYLDWIIKGDFSLFTKKAVKRVVEAMKNQ
ncbi:DNA polymerase III subunit epsilon [Calothrix sp. PCC 7716]|nr:DNA polymerase III subunit epsilon [Calothrix sp. PCC 7716]